MNNKGRKTTTVAYIALSFMVAFIVALFLDKITMDELQTGIIAIGGAAIVWIGILSKDATASHTQDEILDTGGHPDPDKEQK